MTLLKEGDLYVPEQPTTDVQDQMEAEDIAKAICESLKVNHGKAGQCSRMQPPPQC